MPECSISGETCGFQCTGYDGGEIWQQLHKTVKAIQCDSCQQHAIALMSGLHDHVNAGLGKEPFDAKNYSKVVEEINCVYARCVATGRCKI